MIQVDKAGFKPLHPNWPSVVWNDQKKLMLVVYVDDLLLSGPAQHDTETWKQLGDHLKISKPPGDDEFTHTFLGCTSTHSTRKFGSHSARCVRSEAIAAVHKGLARYEVAVFEITGQYPRFYQVKTPFLEEDTKECPFRAPCDEDDHFIECPSCLHTIPKSEAEQLHTYQAGTQRKIKDIREMIPKEGGETDLEEDEESEQRPPIAAMIMAQWARGDSSDWGLPEWEDARSLIDKYVATIDKKSSNGVICQNQVEASEYTPIGQNNVKDDLWNPTCCGAPKYKLGKGGILGVISAMVLMTELYTARAARFDWFQAINTLAKRITRWDDRCDRQLHHLMCYIFTTSDYVSFGWIADPPESLTQHMYADANFAGCPYTLKSTSGEHHNIQGPNSRYPWAAGSGGQTCIAQSTPEAEIVSANTAMKSRGEMSLDLFGVIMKRYHDSQWKPQIKFHEDNTTCITCLRSGINKTMKTLERGFGVSLGWCHGRISSGVF